MTFSNAGCMLSVRLEVLQGDLTATEADCVADAFLAARMHPFSGQPVTVARNFASAP